MFRLTSLWYGVQVPPECFRIKQKSFATGQSCGIASSNFTSNSISRFYTIDVLCMHIARCYHRRTLTW